VFLLLIVLFLTPVFCFGLHPIFIQRLSRVYDYTSGSQVTDALFFYKTKLGDGMGKSSWDKTKMVIKRTGLYQACSFL
jgi:hypothetical protein